MKTAGFLLILSMGSFFADPDNKRLDAFLEKLDRFYANNGRRASAWSMPNLYHRESTATMPMPDIRFFDTETGLEYSPHRGEIYDRDLQIRLDIATKSVFDMKTGKEYKLDELQRRRKGRKA